MEIPKQNPSKNTSKAVIHEDPVSKSNFENLFDFKHLAVYILFLVSMTAVIWTTYRAVTITKGTGGPTTHPISVSRTLNPGQNLNVKTYSNPKYSYEFKYPKDGLLETTAQGDLKIQNYESTTAGAALADGQYNLMMKVSPTTTSCTNSSYKLIKNTPSYSIYTGVANSTSGVQHVLCALKAGQFYKITVTEKDVAGSTADQIFSSFTFTDPNKFAPATTAK
jgi:hypothetical protein